MSTLTIGTDGAIALPDELRERYGLAPDTPVRVLETGRGILLIPLTGSPMSGALARELDEWQRASTEVASSFPYEMDD